MQSTNVRVRAACLAVVMAFALALSSSAADVKNVQTPLSSQQAYTELLSVRMFAFGGIGYGGITSEGEICIRTIAASTNSVALSESLMTSTNMVAKLYAIAALHKRAPETFEIYAKSLRTDKRTVPFMSGCLVYDQPTSVLVNQITSGAYDSYFDFPLAKR